MTQTKLFPETTTRRPERDGRRSDMVLIQVPAVRDRRTRVEPVRGRRQPHGFGRPTRARQPRRRLRREIRMTAYALLAFAPLILAVGVWCLHPTRPLAAAEIAMNSRTIDRSRPAPDADSTPTAVLISIESAGGAIEAETETPVVFPGYLLPDDHREEPVHEGS